MPRKLILQPRHIINIEPKKDIQKSHFDIFRELYDHTEIKGDVSRNMLATVYFNDPNNFKERDIQV